MLESPCPLSRHCKKKTGLLSRPELTSVSEPHWSIHCASTSGWCRYIHRKSSSVAEGLGWLAPISATRFLCKHWLFTLITLQFPTSNNNNKDLWIQLFCLVFMDHQHSRLCPIGHIYLNLKSGPRFWSKAFGPKRFCADLTISASYNVTPAWGTETHLSWDSCFIDIENWNPSWLRTCKSQNLPQMKKK